MSETETMKLQKIASYALVLLFVLLITSSQISAARFLANKLGEEEKVKLGNGTSTEAIMNPENTDSLEKLMGLEKCENTRDDEECMKRREIAEAHLDYIYTQHQNP